MILLLNFIAAFGLLIPVFLFVGLRASRDREIWQIGLDIPTAVSLDVLVVLCLAFLVPVGTATLVSRAVYAVVGAAILGYRAYRRRPLLTWPKAIGRREILLLITAALVGLVVSMWMSRQWIIWDRGWHMPLVASLRGQTLPFKNVFNVNEVLRYHFSADVQAVMLQTLSFSVLHSSLSLSLLHDLHFALTALTLTSFLLWWGYRRVGAVAVGTLALLLTGPAHLVRDDVPVTRGGYSFVNYLSSSFRPPTALAGLLMIGFVGATLARLGSRDDLDWRKTAPQMCACAAALAISDETSLGLLGLTLFLTWLYAPRVIHERRMVGVIVFMVLAAALIVPNLAFSAALAPGGEHFVFKLVRWRSPGYYMPPLSLLKPQGQWAFILDMLGPVAVGLGAVLHVLTRRRRGRGVLCAYLMTLLALSIFGLTRSDINKNPTESHRFVTAVFIIAPFACLALLSRRFPAVAPVQRTSPYAATVMAAGLCAAAVSTLAWVVRDAPSWTAKHHDYSIYNFYQTNCRAMVGATLGARARYTYVARPLYYLVTGCRPTFTPARVSDSQWKAITIGVPLLQKEAVAGIRKALPPGASIPLVCPAVPDKSDVVCAAAEASGSCRSAGLVAKDCELTADQADALTQ